MNWPNLKDLILGKKKGKFRIQQNIRNWPETAVKEQVRQTWIPELGYRLP